MRLTVSACSWSMIRLPLSSLVLVNWWSNTTEEIGVSVDYYSVYGINILSEADILKMRMQTILELLLDTSYLLFSLFMAV